MWRNSIEPSYYHNYAQHNVKSANMQARRLKVPLPEFAVGRPIPVVKELQLRHMRGTSMTISCQPGHERGQFWVEKSEATLGAMHLIAVRAGTCTDNCRLTLPLEERCYQVDILRGQCNCPDNMTNRMICKHIFYVLAHHQQEWKFKDLPPSLLNDPRMVIDSEVVGGAATTLGGAVAAVATDVPPSSPPPPPEEEVPPLPMPRVATVQSRLSEQLHVITSLVHAMAIDPNKAAAMVDLSARLEDLICEHHHRLPHYQGFATSSVTPPPAHASAPVISTPLTVHPPRKTQYQRGGGSGPARPGVETGCSNTRQLVVMV